MKTSQVKILWVRILVLASLAGFAGGSFAFGADFSAKSDSELISLAGTIAPSDEPDFAIEVNKRVNAKPYAEAKDFKRAIKYARKQALYQLPYEQAQKRKIEVCKALQARTDSMTGAQIREAGLKVSRKDCDYVGLKDKHWKFSK
ncbi:DUF1104 domain-containing protein [Helicobacter sp. MIT 01-3238]|uniref:DUF1104 domain-containing protein n=1 Tax=Helicobacter sp. MIT 01-3238 TaxID=398627 RepID=UPI000E1F1DEF|nr:DUF1104 domain-containing protein [Helicobacter sp. MIT 01-3238]RDU53106.1 hypothetical protein CQA40_06150 [Helicobacter sp. MIT 01-3238]